MGKPDLYPKSKTEAHEVNTIIEKLQDKWFAYDIAQGRLEKGTGTPKEVSDYTECRKKIDTDLKRLKVLFHFS